MVESLDEHDAPVQDELDEGTAPASDTVGVSECRHSAVGLIAAAHEAQVTDSPTQNLAKVDIPDLFDPDELMPLHPTAVEEGDEFDDMLC